MKRWRLAQFHPEDRFEPDDEVADELRSRISALEAQIKRADSIHNSVNKLLRERDKLQVDLSVRLYGA